MIEIHKNTGKDLRRNRLVQWFIEYLQNSSIHGYKHIIESKTNLIALLFWIISVLSMIGITCTLITILYMQYVNAPTATIPASTRFEVYDVPFPSIFLCNSNRISARAALNFSKFLYSKQENCSENLGATVDEVYQNVLLIGKIYHVQDIDDDEVSDLNRLHSVLTCIYNGYYSTDEILNELSPNCNDSIKHCIWNGIATECSTIFKRRKTYLGLCCAFNYIRPNADEIRKQIAESGRIKFKNNLYVSGHTHKYGLQVTIDQLIDDYAFTIRSFIGSSILVADPETFLDHNTATLYETLILPDKHLFISITPTKYAADQSLRQFSPMTRRCVFDDEMQANFHSYSLSECLLTCRLNSLFKMCECHPPEYTNIFNRPTCSFSDVLCMSNWALIWNNYEDENQIESYGSTSRCPDCLSKCNLIRYKVENCGMITMKSELRNLILVENQLRNYSTLNVFFSKSKFIQYDQSAIYTWYDILSIFGGICSLTLGVSLMNFIEVFYFMTGRFGVNISGQYSSTSYKNKNHVIRSWNERQRKFPTKQLQFDLPKNNKMMNFEWID